MASVQEKIERAFQTFLISVFFFFGWMRSGGFLSGGHIHRQADTLGMSVAFAERLKNSGIFAFDYLFYPRVLQSAFTNGINASEFPALNVLTGLFMVLPGAWGPMCAAFVMIAIHISALYIALPKIGDAIGIKLSKPEWFFIVLTTGTLTLQLPVFMPEALGMSMLLFGFYFLLRAKARDYGFAFLFLSLSFLIKPTLVAGAASYLLIWRARKFKFDKKFAKDLAVMLFSLLPALWWFKFHSETLRALNPTLQIFTGTDFNPIANLKHFSIRELLSISRDQIQSGDFVQNFGYLVLIAACFSINSAWGILAYVLSLILAFAIAGAACEVHRYYFIGVALPAILLSARVYSMACAKKKKWFKFKWVAFAFVVWGCLFNIRTQVWWWARGSEIGSYHPWRDAMRISKLIPKSHHVITDDLPPGKLILLGRSGSTAGPDAHRLACELAKSQEKTIDLVVSLDEKKGFQSLCPAVSLFIGSYPVANQRWILVELTPKAHDK